MAPIGSARAGVYGGVDAIPASVVSRPQDDFTFSTSSSTILGIRIESTVEWPEIGCEISANTADATEAIIRRVSDSTVVDTTDITGVSAGETFIFDNAGLAADTQYDILLSADSSWSSGYHRDASDDGDVPTTSSDGQLTIVTGVNDGTAISDTHAIVTVGDVGF